MKNLMKTGKVNVWYVGGVDSDDAVVMADLDATDEDLREAIRAEEELDRYRKCAVWN